MHPEISAHVVSESVTFDLIGSTGFEGRLDAELQFDSRDPFAMSVVFLTTPPVTWTFGRELLLTGLFEPTGEGDVQVWPGVTSDGIATILFEFSSPDGRIIAQLERRDVGRFCDRMLHAVPEGREADTIDLDATLEALLGSAGDLSV